MKQDEQTVFPGYLHVQDSLLRLLWWCHSRAHRRARGASSGATALCVQGCACAWRQRLLIGFRPRRTCTSSLLFQALCHLASHDHAISPGPIVQVVGMLPDINGQDRHLRVLHIQTAHKEGEDGG